MSLPNEWAMHYLEVAETIATKSEDQSTKIGCIVVNNENSVLTTGYNGFPRGVKNLPERNERPIKYKYFEHAERNAIYNAARIGVSLKGSTMYITAFPCTDCARGIIQSGVAKVVYKRSPELEERWGEDMAVAGKMLMEAGVKIYPNVEK